MSPEQCRDDPGLPGGRPLLGCGRGALPLGVLMRFSFVAVMLAMLAGFFLAPAAAAEDTAPCAAGMVCASEPARVMAAMEKAGLKPKLTTDNSDDPLIESDEATYHFDVYFYGCTQNRKCDSLRFEALFDKEEGAGAAFANRWNAAHRFMTMSVKDDGRLVLAYDVATIGGLTERNFADVLDWWTSMLDEAAKYFEAELPAKDKKATSS